MIKHVQNFERIRKIAFKHKKCINVAVWKANSIANRIYNNYIVSNYTIHKKKTQKFFYFRKIIEKLAFITEWKQKNYLIMGNLSL